MNICEAVDKYNRETSTYIVAYIDILGVSSRMQQKSENQIEPLNKLYNLYRFVMDLADENTGIKNYSGIKFKIFSDNIVIANRLPQENNKQKNVGEITSLLNCVSNFACLTVGDSVGWLLRGGITIGDFFINDTIIWGFALLRAIELEKSVAKYPRIIIDPIVYNDLEGDSLDYISMDFDGVKYLNYMKIWSFAGQCVKNGFEKIKLEARNFDGSYSDGIYQKLFWHMKYINGELDKKNQYKDDDYRLYI